MNPCRQSIVALAVLLAACGSNASTLDQTVGPVDSVQAQESDAAEPFGTSAPTPSLDDKSVDQLATPTATPTVQPTPAPTVQPTAPPQPTTQESEPMTPTPSRNTDAELTGTSDSNCVRLTDFALEAENFAWFVVNDNVMGGRSLGGPTFVDSSMIFEGEINTNGGGFSSVRIELAPTALDGATHLLIRARTDGRPYKVTLEDSLETRDRRVSQQASMSFAEQSIDGDGWAVARISFDELTPKIFGRDVQSDAFRPDLATQLGIMLSDNVDGPFRLEVDWIDICR